MSDLRAALENCWGLPDGDLVTHCYPYPPGITDGALRALCSAGSPNPRSVAFKTVTREHDKCARCKACAEAIIGLVEETAQCAFL
jgi:hypothetical protein